MPHENTHFTVVHDEDGKKSKRLRNEPTGRVDQVECMSVASAEVIKFTDHPRLHMNGTCQSEVLGFVMPPLPDDVWMLPWEQKKKVH